MDELDALARSLDAERARPDAKPRSTEDLMQELIGALRNLFRTPPDQTIRKGVA